MAGEGSGDSGSSETQGVVDVERQREAAEAAEKAAAASRATSAKLSPETYELLYGLRDVTEGGRVNPRVAIDTLKARALRIPTAADMTPMDREVAQIGAEQWNRYQDKFIPFEDSAIRDILTGDRYAAAIRSAVQADIFRSQPGITDMGRAGSMTPNFFIGRGGGAIPLAGALSTGRVAADQGIIDERVRGMGNVVELGRGGGDAAASAMGRIAGLAAEEAIGTRRYQSGLSDLAQERSDYEANRALASRIGTQRTLNSLMATGTGIGMWYADRQRAPGTSLNEQSPNWYTSPIQQQGAAN